MTAPMPPCQVLRCDTPGSKILNTRKPWQIYEALVCDEHKRQIDEGAPWSSEDPGVIHMGADMPPEVQRWEVKESAGPGVILSLETDRDSKPYEVFLHRYQIEQLGMILAERGGEEYE